MIPELEGRDDSDIERLDLFGKVKYAKVKESVAVARTFNSDLHRLIYLALSSIAAAFVSWKMWQSAVDITEILFPGA